MMTHSGRPSLLDVVVGLLAPDGAAEPPDVARGGASLPRGEAPDSPLPQDLSALASRRPGADADAPAPGPRSPRASERVAAAGGPAVAWARAWAEPDGSDGALVRLADALELGPVEAAACVLARGVDVDPRLARLVGWVQAPVAGSRPSVGLLVTRLAPLGVVNVEAFLAGRALASGMLTLQDAPIPLVDRTLAMPTALVLALGGEHAPPAGARWIEGELPLPPSFLRAAEAHAAALFGQDAALVIRGASAREAEAAAERVARALGARAAGVDLPFPGLGPWLRVCRGIPVFQRSLGPSERFGVPRIPGWAGPVIVALGPDGQVDAPGRTVGTWVLPVPDATERAALWSAHLPAAAARLGAHHRYGPGRIAALVDSARYHAAAEGRLDPSEDDVRFVAEQAGGGMDRLAQPLLARVDDRALVLSAAVRGDLDTLLARCRFREGLAAELGPAAATRYGPGVKALLVGPSGTGKTLAASWIATRLGMPLYRVDLASVVSKYIGETEKNLAEMLAQAESDEVVLLFDEADALFGKRTEVRQATDRYANSQTNYLLQRIESYTGIVLLSSNSRSRFDPAFSRRLDLIIEFPPPGPEERLALWRAHLGGAHRLTRRELNHLAVHCDLAGGHIRNAVLAAAVLAADDKRKIGWAHAVRGVEIESRKLGMPLPSALRVPPER